MAKIYDQKEFSEAMQTGEFMEIQSYPIYFDPHDAMIEMPDGKRVLVSWEEIFKIANIAWIEDLEKRHG